MRAGLCTVSAPLAACGPLGGGSLTTTTTNPSSDVTTTATSHHQLPAHARFLALHLLLPGGPGPQPPTLYFLVQAKARVRDLYHQTCVHFAEQRGMRDTDLFGLALICDGEYLFAEPDSKLSKYAPRSWRTSHSHGLDANGRPALAFYFRVQFYVDSPLLLRDEETRVHYYLQLRLNTAGGAAAEHTTRLAALALQADLGDYHQQQQETRDQGGGGSVETPSRGQGQYRGYRPEDYVPPAMRNPAALRSLEAAHRSLRGLLTPSEARARFIEEACRLQEPVNAHVFRLRASKSEASPGTLLLAVCARGLRVCPDNNPPSTFLWSSIGKLSFERKRFEIRTGHEKLTLYTSCDEKSRLLLALCKAAHQFSMAVAPRLSEARKVEEEERRIRWDGDQRISVISSTSSNTTSGIVSDRVHSEDELEIMITSPPAAPSTESLALAHLLDSTPASSRTSAASGIAGGSSLPVTQGILLSSGLLGRQGDDDNLDGESGRLTCSESSGKTTSPGNGTGGKCAGSQCSSNCSTVVVTPVAFTKGKGRRPSTSSSLELGYSHTAQNSSVSGELSVVTRTTVNNHHQIDNTPQLTEPVYTSGPAPSSHTSGVYTLTSSDQYTTLGSNEQYTTLGSSEQYTTASEEYTTASEQFSEQYTASTSSEILNNQPYSAINNNTTTLVPTTIDQVDSAIVFRDRSNSNISNCGSFRGDGSDPTDNQQTLLSADELSDLIVGGRYPSCKSVSHTLDSDSDYVTLPPTSYHHGYVPVPPRRVDSALQRPRPPPPPYGAQFVKISDVVSEEEFNELLSELSMREPPPYPTENLIPPPQPVYPSSEESPARFITTRPPNILTAHTSLVGISSPPCYSMPHSAMPPLIPPKVPRSTMDISTSTSSGNILVPCAAFLPPPPAPARQPPPPPPPPVATVYTSQLPRSQIEQYRQQMYSDVDFVVFPLKEPAISKQEYLEAKQGSIIAALAQSAANQPVFYRSTPYLARYASSQNLSDTYVQLPVYGAPSICSTTGSLEPVIPPPLPPTRPSNRFMRTQSDDNILNSLDSVPRLQLLQQPPKFRRLPPPPPPPIPTSRTIKTSSSNSSSAVVSKQTALDIRTLRETSKKMDLPLIAALCNDRSLIKQTKAFVMPKHPSNVLGMRQTSAAHVKYPVSGLSSTKINSKVRKPASVSHRHPGDKLPELPRSAVNMAEDSVVVADSVSGGKMILSTRAKPNNYVFTDHPTRGAKHKTMQSHS